MMMASNASPEVNAILTQTHDLMTALSNEPLGVAGILLSKGFISSEISSKMHDVSHTPAEKATILVEAVRNKIEVAPTKFTELLEILSDQTCATEVVESLRSTYQKLLRDIDLQKLLQQVTYAVSFMEEVSKADLDENILSQVEDSLKVIEKLSGSCTDSEDITRFANHLSNVNIATVLMKLTHSLAKLGFTAKTWPCFYALHVVCLRMSHQFESFCTDLGSSGLVVPFVNTLKIYKRAHLSQNPAEEFMAASALALLGNVTANQSIVQILWDMHIIEILLVHAKSPIKHICIPALVLIGLLSLDVDEGSASIDSSNALVLHSALNDAVNSSSLTTEVGYFQMTATELLKGINGLAFNKRNAILLVESGILSHVMKMLTKGNDNDKQCGVEFLWTLASDTNIKEKLRTMSELQRAFDSLSSTTSSTGSLSFTVQSALLKINGWNQLEDVAESLTYVKYAYLQRRYQECVRVCDSIHCAVDTSNFTEDNLNNIKLYMGKSLYLIHKNANKFVSVSRNETVAEKKKEFANAEKAVRVLGYLVDKGQIDKVGMYYLDIAMADYMRKTNNLKSCQRCLLCLSRKKLRSSHVVPNFILSGFAEGMKRSASKKDYIIKGASSEEQEKTPRQAAWYMLCKDCELKVSRSGESSFAKDFFQKVYEKTDPSSPAKDHSIPYSTWLYQFAISIVFRGLAINPKGMSGFMNDEEVYEIFTQCRKVLLQPENLPTNLPQVAIFVNPLSPAVLDSKAASTLHRVLNMPSFMYLAENEEKLSNQKLPRIANFFLAHLGILNIVVTFPKGDFCLPSEFCIDTHSGIFTVPEEDQRSNILPQPIWESLNLVAEVLEVQEMKVTLHRLQGCKIYESSPAVPETQEKVFGLSKAKQNDIETVKKKGFQPSSDPCFPKEFDLLPPGICVNRRSTSTNSLTLPEGHKFLLHCTSERESDHASGKSLFLCVSPISDDSFKGRPYVVVHGYMPGLHLNVGFIVSTKDLSPEEVLPDRNPKFYADVLLAEYQSDATIQATFSRLLTKIGLTLNEVLQLSMRQSQLIVKCTPRCWFCVDKCDACFKPSASCILLYGQKVIFCSESCQVKLVTPNCTYSTLPKDFKIRNEFKSYCEVKVPEGHSIVTHISTPFNSESGTSGELTVFLCKAGQELNDRTYILCHFHSLVEQFSVGMFISTTDLLPMELLPGSDCNEKNRNYIDSLYSTSIVQMTLLHVLNKHELTSIESLLSQSGNEKYHDRRCQPPCWYCQNRCTNCFTICPTDKDLYCSDLCRDKPKSPPHLFCSIPSNFVVKRSFDKCIPSQVTLPHGHRQIFHTTGSSSRPDGTIVSEMTIILCIGDGIPPYTIDKPYVIFQDYKPLQNKLANVSFYISPDDLSIQGPLCSDDVAGHVFISHLHSKQYNIPEGIQEALKRRGFQSMTLFLQESARKEIVDIKCSPPCWYCQHSCDICLKPADIQTDVNGECIQHCSDACLELLFQTPGIIHLLPEGFAVHSKPNIDDSEMLLPNKHRAILHICREYRRKDGRSGHYLLILCVNTETGDKDFPAYEPYVIYHQFNLLRQITFGFYLKKDCLEPSEPLICEKQEDRLRCLRYLQQVTELEPISTILGAKLKEQSVFSFTPRELASVEDKVCALPCWYCRKINRRESK